MILFVPTGFLLFLVLLFLLGRWGDLEVLQIGPKQTYLFEINTTDRRYIELESEPVTHGRNVIHTLFVLTPRTGGVPKVSEGLGELERFVNDPLLLLVVSDFGVTLSFTTFTHEQKSEQGEGKSGGNVMDGERERDDTHG
jgi:hypothetical protein